MKSQLLKILVCPVCNQTLHFISKKKELICKFDALSFPILDGIPILLKNRGRSTFTKKDLI